jgi:hypothetical protein
MRTKILILLSLGALLGFSSCSEEEITPSADNRLVEFPQGNNSYDTEILQIYQKYGTQILYRYNDAMFRWQITDQLGYVSRPADEQYVDAAVRFIKNNCFQFYREDSLKAYLPYRIYLARDLGRLFQYSGLDAAGNNVSIRDTIWHTAATNGYANLCFGLACQRLTTLSDDSLRLAKGELNAALLANAISQGNIQVPATFTKEEVNNVNWSNYVGSYNTYGLLEYLDAKTMTPAQDFVVFLKYLIAYPKEMFEEKFTTKTFDTSGRIARKAKAAKDWMLSEYDIDLDAMAETAIE